MEAPSDNVDRRLGSTILTHGTTYVTARNGSVHLAAHPKMELELDKGNLESINAGL